MSGSRNGLWIGGVVAVVAGLGLWVWLADGAEPTPGGGRRPDGVATRTAGVVKAMPTVPVEERWMEAPPIERADAPGGAKNMVMVILTAARKDQLTPYGGDPETTPFLATTAGKGARFLDTIADSPYSRASVAAMLGGMHSWNAGVVELGDDASTRKVSDDIRLLPERLRAAGWWTGGVTGNFNLNQDGADADHGGMMRGFDRYLNSQVKGFSVGRRQEAGFLATKALELLDARDVERPFYLQLNFIDTHAPVRVDKDDKPKGKGPEATQQAYRSALGRIDHHLERLWADLSSQGLADDTYLVVVSDHGEGLELPSHHGTFHGRLLYESSVAIPWIVQGPGISPNQLVGGLAAGVDVAPTMLDLLGLPVPEGLDGMSHAAVLRGEGARTSREETWSATWHFTAQRVSWWSSARQCQVDVGSQNISDSFVDACYDRRTDPAFTRVVDDPEHIDALRVWADGVGERLAAGE